MENGRPGNESSASEYLEDGFGAQEWLLHQSMVVYPEEFTV